MCLHGSEEGEEDVQLSRRTGGVLCSPSWTTFLVSSSFLVSCQTNTFSVPPSEKQQEYLIKKKKKKVPLRSPLKPSSHCGGARRWRGEGGGTAQLPSLPCLCLSVSPPGWYGQGTGKARPDMTALPCCARHSRPALLAHCRHGRDPQCPAACLLSCLHLPE